MSTLLDVRGARLAVSTFGAEGDPAVLLVGGSGASMDWWEPEFCASLARAGRYVIRYDHRDTGESTSYPPGKPGYRWEDLVADAVGVLAALEVPRAHVVGISMGGAIAQLLALDHPERVSTLTLIATTAGAGDPDLPPGRFAEPAEPDWTDREAVIEYHVAWQRQAASRSRPFDEAAVREVAATAHDRTTSAESAARNHHHTEGGGPWRHRLPAITAPALVLHGTEDPLFPLPHGEALAREIPNARLVALPGAGHELARVDLPVVLRELIAHTS